MIKHILFVGAATLVLAAGSAPAADNLGVPIYPGAKYDEQSSKVQEYAMQLAGGGKGACYRTKDPVKKVSQFYEKEGFKPTIGAATEDDAMLQKGDSLSMTIKNMKSLDNTNDSRFCIAKK